MPASMPIQHQNPTADQLIKVVKKETKTQPKINGEGTDLKRQEKLNEELIDSTFTREIQKK